MILVTGGTGFIGRRLVEQLAQAGFGDDMVCLVHKRCESELEKTGRTIIDKHGIARIEVDLVTGDGLDRVPKSPDTVFHLASITDTSVADHSINDVGTKNLFEQIKPLGKDTHFVFTSSIAVNDKRDDYSVPIDELSDVPQRPCHEYGRKKLLAEQYLIRKSEECGFPLSIVRVCGVYGKGVRKGGLFDSIEKMVLDGALLARLNWPGKISLIHVDDMAGFIVRVSQINPEPGHFETYIPSVEALSLSEMSAIFHKAYGLEYRMVALPKFFWGTCSFFAANKNVAEAVLPHKLYNKFWQACLLVNNEFWNRSIKIKKVFSQHNPTTFEDYYSTVARADT